MAERKRPPPSRRAQAQNAHKTKDEIRDKHFYPISVVSINLCVFRYTHILYSAIVWISHFSTADERCDRLAHIWSGQHVFGPGRLCRVLSIRPYLSHIFSLPFEIYYELWFFRRWYRFNESIFGFSLILV